METRPTTAVTLDTSSMACNGGSAWIMAVGMAALQPAIQPNHIKIKDMIQKLNILI